MAGFSPSGAASGASSSNPAGASGFTITEVSLPGTADTEFTHVISSSTKRFSISVKGTKRFEIFPTTSSTPKWKVKPGNIFDSGPLELSSSLTLYLSSPDIGDTLQIIEWA